MTHLNPGGDDFSEWLHLQDASSDSNVSAAAAIIPDSDGQVC